MVHDFPHHRRPRPPPRRRRHLRRRHICLRFDRDIKLSTIAVGHSSNTLFTAFQRGGIKCATEVQEKQTPPLQEPPTFLFGASTTIIANI